MPVVLYETHDLIKTILEINRRISQYVHFISLFNVRNFLFYFHNMVYENCSNENCSNTLTLTSSPSHPHPQFTIRAIFVRAIIGGQFSFDQFSLSRFQMSNQDSISNKDRKAECNYNVRIVIKRC